MTAQWSLKLSWNGGKNTTPHQEHDLSWFSTLSTRTSGSAKCLVSVTTTSQFRPARSASRMTRRWQKRSGWATSRRTGLSTTAGTFRRWAGLIRRDRWCPYMACLAAGRTSPSIFPHSTISRSTGAPISPESPSPLSGQQTSPTWAACHSAVTVCFAASNVKECTGCHHWSVTRGMGLDWSGHETACECHQSPFLNLHKILTPSLGLIVSS